MKYKFNIKVFLCVVNIIFFYQSYAQQQAHVVIKDLANELITELNDSIKVFNDQFTRVQGDIYKIVENEKLDHLIYYGKDSSYIKPGLSKGFKISFPKIYFANKDKKNNIIGLYRQLDRIDLKVRITKKVLAFVQAFSNSTFKYINEFGSVFLPNFNDKDLLKLFIISRSIGNFYYGKKIFDSNASYGNERDLKDLVLESKCETKENANSEMEIGETWPKQGQYAYYPSFGAVDFKQGYIKIENGLSGDFNQNQNLYKVKWTAQDGRFVLTDIKYDFSSNNTLNFFNADDFLEPGKIYKMELVRIDDSNKNKYKKYLNVFSAPYLPFRVTQTMTKTLGQTIFSKTYEPIFFRVSLFYSMYDKLKTADTLMRKDDVTLMATFDEAFDEYEFVSPECYTSGLSFSIYHNEKKFENIKGRMNSRIDYYLKVPEIGSNMESALLMSKEDNTLGEEVFINCSKNISDNYINKSEINSYDLDKLSVSQDKKPNFISPADFKNGSLIDVGEATLFFLFEGVRDLKHDLNNYYSKVVARSNIRANYYYNLDLLNDKSSNISKTKSKEFYIEREKNILKDIFGEDIEKQDFKPEKGNIYINGNAQFSNLKVLGFSFKF